MRLSENENRTDVKTRDEGDLVWPGAPSFAQAGRWFFSWSEGWEIKSVCVLRGWSAFSASPVICLMSISGPSVIKIDSVYLPPFCTEEKSPSLQKDGAPG
jgi:hypothetical protein